MEFLKKNKFGVILLVVLLIATILCGIAIGNYKGTSSNNQNRSGFGMNSGNHFSINEKKQSSSGLTKNITPGSFSNNKSGSPKIPNNMKPANNNGANDKLSGGNAPNGNESNMKHPNGNNNGMGPSDGNSPPPMKDDNNQSNNFKWNKNYSGNNHNWDFHKIQGGGFNSTGGTTLNSNVSKGLIIYSIMFIIAVISVAYLLFKNKIYAVKENKKAILVLVLAIGFILRVLASTFMYGHNDLTLFKNWAESLVKNFTGIYSSDSNVDYPPLYLYVLGIIGKLSTFVASNKYIALLLKLPSIAADIASAFLIYKLSGKYLKNSLSIWLSIFYILNPAIFINSTFWGQVDSFFTLILLLSIYFMTENKIKTASVFFTMGVLMKPQGIIFLPVLFFDLVRKKEVRDFIKAVLAAVCTIVLVALPFSINSGMSWLLKLYTGTVNEYPYGSVNAFNFFSLINSNFKSDTLKLGFITYHNLGMLFIILITMFCGFVYLKSKDKAMGYISSLILISGVFTFATSMHERYLFPAVALSIFAYIQLKDIRMLILTFGYSATVFINTYYVLFNLSGSNAVGYNAVLVITSIMNIGLFGYLVKICIDIVRKSTLTTIANY